jgi:hypothetical protein
VSWRDVGCIPEYVGLIGDARRYSAKHLEQDGRAPSALELLATFDFGPISPSRDWIKWIEENIAADGQHVVNAAADAFGFLAAELPEFGPYLPKQVDTRPPQVRLGEEADRYYSDFKHLKHHYRGRRSVPAEQELRRETPHLREWWSAIERATKSGILPESVRIAFFKGKLSSKYQADVFSFIARLVEERVEGGTLYQYWKSWRRSERSCSKAD